MNKLLPFGCSGIIFLGCVAPAIAQVSPVESTSARDLTIEPRIGGGVSTSGAGIPRFSHIEGFAPLLQTPGEDVLFLEGRLLWLDYERVGTNLTLGYRSHDQEGDRIFGGYISYDSQDTGNNRFNQLGLGFERLGDDWDLRLNGYVPIGENRKQVGSTVSTTSNASISGFNFQGHFLLFSGTQTREDRTEYEAAMLAIEGEAGGKLLDISDFGQVRGYGGLYYLDATNSTALGWRARLEARAFDNYNVGLGVQHDAVFGTNFVFNFEVNFGGRYAEKKEEELPLRMGEFITRNHAIIVDEQTEITTSSETFETIALNPVTGEQWFFQHVSNTGSSGGDGTFESPFGTIPEGINEANTNSTNNQNEIVYVQFGNNPTTSSAITIPDNIQLLSIAPTQTIDTQEGTIQLPLSGAGMSQRPQINATVTMGNNSVLSGFDINLSGLTSGNGVFAGNVTGFTIEENLIRNTPQYGIRAGVDNGSSIGSMLIQNNTLSNIGGGTTSGNNPPLYDGIFIGAANGSTITDVTITGNTISNVDNDGIAIGATNNSTLSLATITNNTISTVGRFGIGVGVDTAITGLGLAAESGSTVSNVAITNNSITDAGESSVFAPPVNIVPGGSVGVAIESSSSSVCFNLSNNTSISPNNLVVTANLDLYLQKTVTGISEANFQIVNRDTINNNNNQFETITIFDPLTMLATPPLATSATNVASCP